mmetsp:Transcript_36379/g.89116  ORF Transcript_36379/g.89116 Transcript_36379/m.89116 type:complete len:538 (+) Transcript_36379:2-1615(+)
MPWSGRPEYHILRSEVPTQDMPKDPVQNGAWWTLSSAMMMMLVCGTVYAFGEFSSVFKEEDGYNLSQTKVQLLALAANLGNYTVLDAGVIISLLGTTAAMAYGCIFACAGYLLLWWSVAFQNGDLQFWCLAVFCFLYGHGCGCIDNSCMSEALADFPDHKGNVVGCLKAYYGLASATIAIVYYAIFSPVETSFLLFLGVYSALMGGLFVPVVQKTKCKVEEPNEVVAGKFRLLTFGLLGFAILFCVVNALSPTIDKLPGTGRVVWIPVLVVVCAGIGSIFLLARPGPRPERTPDFDLQGTPGDVTLAQAAARQPPRDTTGLGMLAQLDFWLLMVVLTVAQGAGLMFLNNSGQILPALEGHEDKARVTSFVAVISVFNSLGRLGYGNGSEAVKDRVSRPAFLVLSLVILTSCYALLSLLGDAMLWPAAVMVGVGYGGLWGVQPVIVSELFGPTDFGFKYACSNVAALMGSLCFGTLLAGGQFDRVATDRGESPYCYAPECFDVAFGVTAVCGVPALGVCVLLWARTRWVYDRLGAGLQ